MKTRVSDILKIMEKIAPLALSASWDNSGLQAGDSDWPVTKVVTALEPTLEVVEYACSVGASILITHHPLIFRPLKMLDFSSVTGRIIKLALENKMAIYSAHTNMDSVPGGINDILAQRLGLKEVEILSNPNIKDKCKLVFFAPTEQKNKLLKELFSTTAGIIGDYTCCSFLSAGNGTFLPGKLTHPFNGEPGKVECVDEIRIETVVDTNDVHSVVSHLKKVHPYEEMAYDIYPLVSNQAYAGIGRVGYLSEPLRLGEFAQIVKKELGLDYIKIAGDVKCEVKKVAISTGSGSSLVKDFVSSGADVFISGDLHYHDAVMTSEKGLALIDAGHFNTEIIISEALKCQLDECFLEKKLNIECISCPVEKDPFRIV